MNGKLLSALQFLLLTLLVWPWAPARIWLVPVLLLILGTGLGIWALSANRPGNFNVTPDLKPDARFITDGPYAHVRHPMYLALLLAGLGLVALFQDWPKLLCWIALLVVLRTKSGMEEKAMAARFPGYRDYASMTGRFLPKIMIG